MSKIISRSAHTGVLTMLECMFVCKRYSGGPVGKIYLNWSQLVSIGINWYQLVSIDLNWYYQMILIDLNWSQLISIDLNWYQLIFSKISTHLIRFDRFFEIFKIFEKIKKTEKYGKTQKSIDLNWSQLISNDLNWSQMISIDLKWSQFIFYQKKIVLRHIYCFYLHFSIQTQ